MSPLSRRLVGFLGLGVLAFLWIKLTQHLAVEWSINSRYYYGWAVPALCGYLLWRDRHSVREVRPMPAKATGAVLIWLAALLYGPTRLVQEANPEWRLVSWALALEVVGLTMLVLPWLVPLSGQSWYRNRPFPFLFFLVAVPWPTLIEMPLIRGLSAMTAEATTVLLGLWGVPTLRHGNLIETAGGVVGIEEACSGVRSIQASLMISLFLGELYRASRVNRIICVAAGLGLALCGNLIRTVLLAWIAADQGCEAIGAWHDRAGLYILLGCFCGTWFLAARFKTCRQAAPAQVARTGARQASRTRIWIPLALACWIGFVEVGTTTWYRLHEARMARPVRWHVASPRQRPGFEELRFGNGERQVLRFDEGRNIRWRELNGLRWQAIFLSWKPGAVAVQLARNHTPEDCLVASGYQISGDCQVRAVLVHELVLPFRAYEARDQAGPVRVFYCLWQDRAPQRSLDAAWLSYASRLNAVRNGERNLGQRSLQLALWGAATDEEAHKALNDLLPEILEVEH